MNLKPMIAMTAYETITKQSIPGANNAGPGEHHSAGEKHSWKQSTKIKITAYSQILNRERDPGLVSKIGTTNETVSLNSHSCLQC